MGDDDRDTLGIDPGACPDCGSCPCLAFCDCEVCNGEHERQQGEVPEEDDDTLCLTHGKEREIGPYGVRYGGCPDCEGRDEADL
jgi:hypothetical protein